MRRDRPGRVNAQSDRKRLEESTPSQTHEPPLFVPLYNPRMQISGSRGQVGGATLAHWSGEKEACISLDPDIRTRGSAIFPFTKSSEGDSAAPLGVVLQQEEEEEVEAMVGGCRKMAAV